MYPYSLPRALFDEAVAKERLTVAKPKKIVAFAQIKPGLSAHKPGERYGDPNRRDDGLGCWDRSELHDRINQLQKDLSSDGYTVIRELLTADQVESLRLIVTQHLKSEGRYQYGGKFQLHAMYVAEEIARFLTSGVILNRLTEITQPLDVNTTSSWHTDVPHHPACIDGTIFADESFKVYKIAFYLQDQDENSPATLKVRPRSHLNGLVKSMPEKGLGIRAGDAIIFDVRIEHAGQMPTFVDRSLRKFCGRIGPRLRVDSQKAFTVARSVLRRMAGTPDSIALFMTFGPSNAWTHSYAEEGCNRHPEVRGTLSAEVLRQLAANNIAPPIIGLTRQADCRHKAGSAETESVVTPHAR
ncbi:phytanoyl-CoA dioxygenase [Rhizobium leguminosarum]|uniref:phytanoyl-CoA dioxygenase n=1 Tax=Rhizobium leguminosarum TaxID=384 RepID=UPI0021BC20B4|nr:phytanoyl-CoA dioxygenase [Rhizobium leguminosarum]